MLPQVLSVISFVLALFASWAVLEPMFSSSGDHTHGVRPDAALDAVAERLKNARYRKEETFLALEELEQDFRAGKVAPADYESSKAELLADAAAQHAEIERLS